MPFGNKFGFMPFGMLGPESPAKRAERATLTTGGKSIFERRTVQIALHRRMTRRHLMALAR